MGFLGLAEIELRFAVFPVRIHQALVKCALVFVCVCGWVGGWLGGWVRRYGSLTSDDFLRKGS